MHMQKPKHVRKVTEKKYFQKEILMFESFRQILEELGQWHFSISLYKSQRKSNATP